MAIPRLKIGDGKWAVKEDNLLGYYEGEHGRYVPKPMTWTRADANGTLVNKDGLIERVPYNLLTYSEEFDNAAWSKSACSVVANVTTSPDGTNTAYKLIEDLTTAQRAVYQTVSGTVANAEYTISAYLKPDGSGRDLRLTLLNNAFSSLISIQFDVSTLTLINAGATGTSVNLGSTITEEDNGWYRITLTGTINDTSLKTAIYLMDGTNATYSGDGVSGGYIYGLQLVQGTEPLVYYKTEDRLNIPRINFSDSSDGALLLEPARTNICLQSEDFTTTWGLSGCTATANSATSPDGTTNADEIQMTTGDENNGTSQVITISNATTYNISQFFSNVDVTGVTCLMARVASGTLFRRGISWNGSVPTIDASFDNGSVTNLLLEDYGNGWYRLSFSFLSDGTSVTFETDIDRLNEVENPAILLWGAQLEAGAYPTTYIPTTTTAVTRNADTGTGVGTAATFNSESGVLFLDAAALFNSSTVRTVSISDGTTSNRIYVGYSSVSQTILATIYTGGGGAQADLGYAVSDITDVSKIAFRYAVNDFSLWIDGVERATDVSGSVAAANTLNTLRLDSGAGSSPFYGKINAIAHYDYLTDDQMKELTSEYGSYPAMALDLEYNLILNA